MTSRRGLFVKLLWLTYNVMLGYVVSDHAAIYRGPRTEVRQLEVQMLSKLHGAPSSGRQLYCGSIVISEVPGFVVLTDQSTHIAVDRQVRTLSARPPRAARCPLVSSSWAALA